MAQHKNNTNTKEYYDMLIAKKQYEDLKKPWYKKLEYLKLIVTSVLTFFSVILLYKNGFFDLQTKTLQAERNALTAEKEHLEYAKKKLTDEKDSLQSITARLIDQNRELALQGVQYEMIKKRAFESLDAREKYFAKVMARNVQLERSEQAMLEAKKENEKIRISIPYPMSTVSALGYSGNWSNNIGSNSFTGITSVEPYKYVPLPIAVALQENNTSLNGTIKSYPTTDGSLTEIFSKYYWPGSTSLYQSYLNTDGKFPGVVIPSNTEVKVSPSWMIKEISKKENQ